MARAEAAGPEIARRSSLFGIGLPVPPRVSGHARLFTRPAYDRLVAAEPLLRRLIPILIAIFLVIVGLTRVVELYGLKLEREAEARSTVSLVAMLIAATLRGDAAAAGTDPANALSAALPAGATAEGRRVYLTDPAGKIVAAAPDATQAGVPLTAILSDAQPLTTFGERAGVLEVPIGEDVTALATVHLLDPPYGMVAV